MCFWKIRKKNCCLRNANMYSDTFLLWYGKHAKKQEMPEKPTNYASELGGLQGGMDDGGLGGGKYQSRLCFDSGASTAIARRTCMYSGLLREACNDASQRSTVQKERWK
jgi:hypothetical protein